jgi:hypothetical protein
VAWRVVARYGGGVGVGVGVASWDWFGLTCPLRAQLRQQLKLLNRGQGGTQS